MRTILFYIPAELAGLPVFGFGWLLGVWIAIVAGLMFWHLRRGGSRGELAGYAPIALLVAAVIAIVLPRMVEFTPQGQPLGVAVRGFGVMMMLATVSGVGLSAYRARQVGLDVEEIYSLAFCMFLAGIVGARLFYLVQYRGQFKYDTIPEIVLAAVNVTKGGLVVYGSVLAGVPAGIWYLWRRKLPILAIGDVIAPGMALGLAIGRLGCFLNGCCFGGICLTAPYAMTFPAGSPPYLQHESSGWKGGVWLDQHKGRVRVAYIAPGSPAERSGLAVGDEPVTIGGAKFRTLAEARLLLLKSEGSYEIATARGIHRWNTGAPPPRSVPIHPTQLYAAIDAALLALLLWAWYPYRRRDGEVFALLITIHPISRYLLELVRDDESGQFGTALTISQWLSLAILAAACLLWWFVERQRPGTALPPPSRATSAA